MNASHRSVATLSLDLDNQWAYMRVHGDEGWDRFPSFFHLAIPRMLDVLASRRLAITVFVVGQDAALAEHRELLSRISGAGHAIGNHSFHHRPSLAGASETDIDEEMRAAEDAIELATGVRPKGFRGPGFSLSSSMLRVLKRRGYLYDASTFPTFIGPLARAYYRATVKDAASGSEERENLYGNWRDVWRPLKPYRWQLTEGPLLELPVTTFPGFRLPFHLTYLLHLAQHSPTIALTYFRAALLACRMSNTAPSLLLHALDFLGRDDVPDLAFFPGMNMSGAEKTAFVGQVLDALSVDFTPITMEDYALSVGRDPGRLKSRTPSSV